MIPLILSAWTPVAITELVGAVTAVAITGKKLFDYYQRSPKEQVQNALELSKFVSQPAAPIQTPAQLRKANSFAEFLKAPDNLKAEELFLLDYQTTVPAIAAELETLLVELLSQLQTAFVQTSGREQQISLIQIVMRLRNISKQWQEPLFNISYEWKNYIAENNLAETLLKTALELKRELPQSWADELRSNIRAFSAKFEQYLNERRQQLSRDMTELNTGNKIMLRLKGL